MLSVEFFASPLIDEEEEEEEEEEEDEGVLFVKDLELEDFKIYSLFILFEIVFSFPSLSHLTTLSKCKE